SSDLFEAVIVIANARDPIAPFICQPDAIAVALEDLKIEALFNCRDISAYSGFLNCQCLGCLPHAAQFRRLEHIFQIAQGSFVHAVTSSSRESHAAAVNLAPPCSGGAMVVSLN